MILCCKCGILIEPRLMNMCDRCLVTEVTISSKVKRNLVVERCRGCERYLQPPKSWEGFSWGSKELLLFLIKKNKTLNGLCIVDSNFVYTEPNSKRIVVALTVSECGVEQPLEIKYVIKNMQCSDCAKVEAKQFWNSLVQVRHRGRHKRMMIYLEHLVLKNNAYGDTSNIKQRKEGLDFYYIDRNAASRMVSFLQSVLPVKTKVSERLISKDVHTSKCNYKFSYSVEIAPLCKDDLVVVGRSLSQSLGIGSLVLVQKIATSIVLFDVGLMKSVRIAGSFYWSNQDEFKVLMSSKDFTKYSVVMRDERRRKGGIGYDLTVTSDGSVFSEARFHLGNVEEDDEILGYDLRHLNLTVECEEKPEVVLVRKMPRDDVVWKIDVPQESQMEYRLFVEDVENDKEMVEGLCLVEEKGGIDKKIEAFRVS
ncbi:nonsense-mediated mRNA decay protein [Encephalitozoon intestinalis ATCC 50506]|uniref:60S ribosomal export protein NMD3 n=1 Tax=Encephalitozoon intestinalis (strain ATCC 50506) TaxID=876142 RepID=E0S8Z4_ENCIT|nr:nonsense-mediated mRNA decay protein [Encephalitozoon intestinalis ATCC 50506]ADM12260.1 nonsense-mediated mRNA decay protein [Encephalitozoon intestinalis ATCC 50506]UTX46067.1 ribosomal export protein NMD3 [Encephalitozoon intestinalis]